jgi:hypothetical protein
MQRISSSGTFFSKRVFPVLFLGFLGYFALDAYRNEEFSSDPFLIVGIGFMAVVGLFIFRVFVWDLADEVNDHGTYLEVRRGSVVEKIEFKNIMNVSAAEYINPPRVTLRLVRAGAFGTHVSFSPKVPFSFRPLARSAVVEALAERAYAARARSAASQETSP